MSTRMTPLVVDLFHGDVVNDWNAVFASGIRGVIHKATQGASKTDETYSARRPDAIKAGLLWGAYHYGTNADVTAQVEHFLAVAKPDSSTLLALDYEPDHNQMSLEQARQFLQMVQQKTGQHPVLYSGNLIKEQLKKPNAFLNGHRLWLAQYGPKAKLPPGWSQYWLHQYTGDGVGPDPHECPGISTKGIDLNVFGGRDLKAEWASPQTTPVSAPLEAQTAGRPRKIVIKERVVVDAKKSGGGGFGIPGLDSFLSAKPVGFLVAGDVVMVMEADAGLKRSLVKPDMPVDWTQEAGWVDDDALGDFLAPELVPLDEMDFVTAVMDTARAYKTNAFYLIEVAQAASGLKNDIDKASDLGNLIGPFRFTQGEWDELVAKNPNAGLSSSRIGNPVAQCTGAAIMASDLTKKLADASGLGRQPKIPELYLATLVGPGVTMHLLKKSPDGALGLDAALGDYPSNAPDRKRLDAVRKRDQSLFAADGQPNTIGKILDLLGTRLNEAKPVAENLLNRYYEKFPSEAPPADTPSTRPAAPLPAGMRATFLRVVQNLATNAKSEYLDMLKAEKAWETLTKYEIATNLKRLGGFLATGLHETGGLTVVRESLNYSTIERLRAVWPPRFGKKSDAELEKLLHNERGLARAVYEGRMKNRVGTEDGYIFRGAGFLQTTGRENFMRLGKPVGIDYSKDPPPNTDDLEALFVMAAAEWKEGGCNQYMDSDKFDVAQAVINVGNANKVGAVVELEKRRDWYRKVMREFEKVLHTA